jgi:hypothetical protein
VRVRGWVGGGREVNSKTRCEMRADNVMHARAHLWQ